MITVKIEAHNGHGQNFEFENQSELFWYVWNEKDHNGDLNKYYIEEEDEYDLTAEAFEDAMNILVHDSKSFEVTGV